jgi:hypothetical protein
MISRLPFYLFNQLHHLPGNGVPGQIKKYILIIITLGPINAKALSFLADLGRRMA